ncbi:1-acyl-sn-glycerol-3-phosphate acyltransferase delta-like [Adelges cooleyi]|uniref:1-acyl-sn-glycerol-3-phosphate acyltransferase delta-like n=1 Tax=Adelges cooleyi TaxID=133065 RepID=UPI0021804D92|nr:1-acyl-sn-glycerol-3-phosphate acyltransferase delta-like [Adelges cooleyi]
MNFSKLKSSPIIHTLFTLKFLVSGLIVNLFQGLFCLILWPHNKDLFRKINYYLSACNSYDFVFLSDWWAGVDYYFYVDKNDFNKYYGKEHGLLIVNHTFEIDWLSAWCYHDRSNILGGCKAFAKNSLKYMPVIGWSWWFSEYLFIQRDLVKDKRTIEVNLKELYEQKDPIWLLLYSEGTRFTEEKKEASQTFARSRGLPELKHHLLPRTKGFSLGLPHIRHNLPAVYNFQVAFKGEKPTLINLFNARKIEAHVYMERIPIEQIPNDEKECDKWMYTLYEKKDKMTDSFNNTGDWFKESGVERVEGFKTKPKYYSLINIIVWLVIIYVPLTKFAFSALLTFNILHLVLLVILFFGVHTALAKLRSVSEINKAASSYGKENSKKSE